MYDSSKIVYGKCTDQITFTPKSHKQDNDTIPFEACSQTK